MSAAQSATLIPFLPWVSSGGDDNIPNEEIQILVFKSSVSECLKGPRID